MRNALASFFESIGKLFAPEKDVEELERTIQGLRDELRVAKEHADARPGSSSPAAFAFPAEGPAEGLVPAARPRPDVFETLPDDPAAATEALREEVVVLREEKGKLEALVADLVRDMRERRERVKRLGAALFDAAIFD